MKPITIEGQNFEYMLWSGYRNGVHYIHTHFYQGMATESHKPLIFFGPTKTYQIPKFVFTLKNVNIEDPHHTKEDIKAMLLKELAVVNHRKEIENGEIV